MRYVIALAMSVVLIVGLIVVSLWVQANVEAWEAEGPLLAGQAFAKTLASFVHGYWFVLFPAVILIFLGAAASAPKAKKPEPQSPPQRPATG